MPEARFSRAVRRAVRARAAEICEYCRSQERFAAQAFSVEHIIPLEAGGGDAEDNLALACQGCNNHKYTKVAAIDPVTAELVSLFHPRCERWQSHFIWTHDFTMIVGLTPTGRATVDALRLNRSGLVNLRRVLVLAGEHPVSEGGDES